MKNLFVFGFHSSIWVKLFKEKANNVAGLVLTAAISSF